MQFLFKMLCLNLCLSSIVLPAQQRTVDVEETMARAMSFDMQSVLERYKKDYQVQDELIALHRQELMRYLVMCSLSPKENIEMMSKEVDQLWHTFILFTKEYARFCKQVADRFIHHVPNVEKQVNNIKEKAETFMRTYTTLFREAPNSIVWNQLYTINAQIECGDCHECMGD